MQEEKTLLTASLGFLVKDGQVLLAMKTQKIGKGCWNGYGGGIEAGETPEQSLVRELSEEAGLVTLPEFMAKVAVIDFYNTKSDGSQFVCRVHIYLVSQWQGEPQETETMVTPTWFSKDQLPLDDMMPADKKWLPVVLSGQKILAEARYAPFQQSLLEDVKIQYVDSFV